MEGKNIRFKLHPFKRHFLIQNISAFYDIAIFVSNEILRGHLELITNSS